MALRIMYSVFVGILVSLFIGLGISAFYPAPAQPEYPTKLEGLNLEPTASPNPEVEKLKKERDDYYEAQEKYRKEISPRYNRNVSIASMIGAIVVLIISLVFVRQIKFLSDGLLLGGVLTLLYSVIRGFMTEENMYRFVVVSVGLVVALVLGYVKFIKDHEDDK